MFRVVTKSFSYTGGQRRRTTECGPWQPHEQWATDWANYLRSTGNYERVEIESNVIDKTAGNGFTR